MKIAAYLTVQRTEASYRIYVSQWLVKMPKLGSVLRLLTETFSMLVHLNQGRRSLWDRGDMSPQYL